MVPKVMYECKHTCMQRHVHACMQTHTHAHKHTHTDSQHDVFVYDAYLIVFVFSFHFFLVFRLLNEDEVVCCSFCQELQLGHRMLTIVVALIIATA